MAERVATLEEFVSAVHAHVASNAEPTAIVHLFKRSSKAIRGTKPALDKVLAAVETLTLEGHAPGMACTLALACDGGRLKGPAAVGPILHFLGNCPEPAVAACPKEAPLLVRALTAHAMTDAAAALAALRPVRRCIHCLQTHGSNLTPQHLTPYHAAYLQLCLATKQYYLGRRLLDQDIYELGGTGLQSADYLLYCFYGAKVCIAIKDHHTAARLLELACTMPTGVGDAIMLAAWHHLQLVVPLHTGRLAAMPKHASPAWRQVAKDVEPVATLARDFVQGKAKALVATLAAHEALFQDLGIYGLALQLQARLPQRAIRRLPATYLTLSLQEVAAEAGLPGAEAAQGLLTKMISRGEVQARIDAQAGTVEFSDHAPQAAATLLPALQARIAALAGLQARMQEATKAARLEQKHIAQDKGSRGGFELGAGGLLDAEEFMAIDG